MLDAETITVLARRRMGGTRAADVVAWANALLSAGQDTPTLRMLAGFGPPFYWSEVEKAFGLAPDELGVCVPEGETLLWRYARIAAQAFLDGKTDAAQTENVICHIWRGLDCMGQLAVWSELDDIWQDIKYGREPYLYPTDTRANFDECVRDEARNLLAETQHLAPNEQENHT